VTVYLWHNVMIAVAWPLLTYLALDDLGVLDGPVTLVVVLLLTAVATVTFGWVEDLAARRRPRLWPVAAAGRPGRPPAAPVDAPQAVSPVAPQGALTGPTLAIPALTAPTPIPAPAVPSPAVPDLAAPRPGAAGHDPLHGTD
jgi:hypothetical protein